MLVPYSPYTRLVDGAAGVEDTVGLYSVIDRTALPQSMTRLRLTRACSFSVPCHNGCALRSWRALGDVRCERESTVTARPTQSKRSSVAPDAQQEISVHLDALRELGPGYSDAVAASLMERLEQLIEAKIDERLARSGGSGKIDQRQVGALAITLGLAIPLTAVAGGIGGLTGFAVVWLAILFILWRLRIL